MAGPNKPMSSYEKPQNIFKTYTSIIKDMKKEWKFLIIVIILLITASIINCIIPMRMGVITDNINFSIDAVDHNPYYDLDNTSGTILVNWFNLVLDFAIVAGLYAVVIFCTWLAEWIVVRVSADYAYDARKRIKLKLDRLPLSYYDQTTVGEILSRGTNDVDNISSNMTSVLNQTITGVTQLIAVTAAMFISEWRLALVAIATLPINIIVVSIIGSKSQKQFKIYREKLGNLNGVIEETYGGLNVIKLFNKEEDLIEKFEVINKDMAISDKKSQWISGFIFPTMRFVGNLGFIGVCVVSGMIGSVGNMVAFFLFLDRFQQPFQQIGQIIGVIQSVGSSAERIYKLLDEKEIEPDKEGCIDNEDGIKGKIEIEHIDFSYNPNKPLIKDMTLDVRKGHTIAIVGPTGSGKTTIVNLIMRFYEVDAGRIVLDGHDIKDYSRNALRGSVGMVLQDTWLFSGTIKENIKYGRLDATDEEVIEAAKAAHAHHFIETLPGGYDFILNEDGTNISQGQRQLITIARAIISQPKIMILDEATSSVDTRTEQAIQDAMNKMMEGKTSFVIAHRLSTIKNAKLIVVMKKGEIVEMGNHKELLAQKGFYADLYNTQFSGKNPLAPQDGEVDS